MKQKWLRVLLPLVFWLLVWQLAAVWVERGAPMGGEFLLPGPVHVWEALIGIATAEVFWKTALLSVGRMFFGIFLGALLGVALAVLTAANRWCDLLLSPAVKVVRAVPVASFILLVLLWVRRDWVPVAIAALMVLPVIWGAVRQGIDTADRQLLELTRCYRFDRGKTLRLFWVPSIAPAFTTGLATAMGLAWKAGVAAEVLTVPKLSIGRMISESKLYLMTEELFAWTLAVVCLSLLLQKAMLLVLKGRDDRAET